MTKDNLIAAVLEHPEIAFRFDPRIFHVKNGHLEPREGGWKYVSHNATEPSFFVTDEYMEDFIWKRRNVFEKIYEE